MTNKTEEYKMRFSKEEKQEIYKNSKELPNLFELMKRQNEYDFNEVKL